MALLPVILLVLGTLTHTAVINSATDPRVLDKVNYRIAELAERAQSGTPVELPQTEKFIHDPKLRRGIKDEAPILQLELYAMHGDLSRLKSLLKSKEVQFDEATLSAVLERVVSSYIVTHSQVGVAKALLRAGADVNYTRKVFERVDGRNGDILIRGTESNGKTLLMIACERQNPEMIKLLIMKGADKLAVVSKHRDAIAWLNSTVPTSRYEECKKALTLVRKRFSLSGFASLRRFRG